MRHARLFLLLGVVCLTLWLPLRAQLTPLVRMNFSSPPNYGWSPYQSNAQYWRLTHLPTTGPNNTPAAEIALIPQSGQNQFYAGWRTSIPATPSGQARYLRLYMRMTAFRDVNTNKMVILGDGAAGRTIIEARQDINDYSQPRPSLRIQQNIAGPDKATTTVPMVLGEWTAYQFEVLGSSSGGYKLWKNSDTYGSPTAVSPRFALASDWADLSLGFYHNEILNSGGHTYQWAAFEWDDQFDPGWYARMGSGGGPTPTPTPPAVVAPAAPRGLKVGTP